MKHNVPAMLIALLVAGCASSHLRTSLPSYSGSDAATLYVARPHGAVGAFGAIHIVLDGKVLGVIGEGQYWEMTLPPGHHTIATFRDSRPFILKPHETVCYSTGYAVHGVLASDTHTWLHVAIHCPPPRSWSRVK